MSIQGLAILLMLWILHCRLWYVYGIYKMPFLLKKCFLAVQYDKHLFKHPKTAKTHKKMTFRK